ncbi:MAG: hypothetical protein U1E27_11400, partial [Kiritimatiellia bacterium]|nr:hypothetical protein [Kiritimatiellia bacterium]
VHGEQNAMAILAGVDANRNRVDSDGIQATLVSDGGGAQVYMVGVDADSNTRGGVMLSVTGAVHDVYIGLIDVDADENAKTGIEVLAHSVLGDAVALLADSDTRGNGSHGTFIQLDAGGDAGLGATYCYSLENELIGFRAGLSAGNDTYLFAGETAAEDLDAVFNYSADLGPLFGLIPTGPVDFSHNGMHGMMAYLASASSDVHVGVDGAAAGYNTMGGFQIILSAPAGDVDVRIENTTANMNAAGLKLQLYGVGGTADVWLGGITANGNGVGGGITVDNNYNGWVNVSGQSLVSVNNSSYGVYLYSATGTPVFDFGGGALGSPGLGSYYNNTLHAFRYDGPGTVSAENNWWGTAAPDGSLFSGSVDFAPWLVTDPNAP